MASITSLMGGSSSTSSLSNMNRISGLASGLDTESMVQASVQGYETKISSLQQDLTMLQWEQDAYRSILSKMSSFSSSYLSYTSSTNLLSQSFFTNALNVSTSGTYADLVAATGKTDSNVQILGVKQLATAASYTVTGVGGAGTAAPTISGGEVDLSADYIESMVSGTLKINYGQDRSFTINLAADEIYADGKALADAINEKLGEQDMTLNDGTTVKANTRISVNYDDATGQISFSDGANAGNSVWIKSASGAIVDALGVTASNDYDASASSFTVGSTALSGVTGTYADKLAEKGITFNLNGTSKTIKLDNLSSNATMEELKNALSTKLNEAFGSQITVDLNDENGLTFTTSTGSTLSIGNGSSIGLASDSETSYTNTGQKLGDILGEDVWNNLTSSGTDKDGNAQYDLEINGAKVQVTKEMTLSQVTDAINKSGANVNVSFSQLTNQFTFTYKETGSMGKVELGAGLAQELFGGGTSKDGQDAILSMSVNGTELKDITRSSNQFDVDGLSVNLTGTFNYENGTLAADAASKAVSFKVETDTDKVIDTVKDMIEQFNTMIKEIKNAYSTQPLKNTKGDRYEPLTEDDQADMSDSEIARYEEKAKTGILFGDNDLSGLYSGLISAISSVAPELEKVGISTVFEDGITTLKLDESKMEDALKNDPNAVKDVFAGTATTDGLMESWNNTLEKYGKTTGATKGILVEKAGSPLATTSMLSNQIQTEMDKINEQIAKWQAKLADKVDFYTRQFTQLEILISDMNSQSGALAGLMGGY